MSFTSKAGAATRLSQQLILWEMIICADGETTNEEAKVSYQGRAARRNTRRDPGRCRISVLQARPERRDAARRGPEGRRPHLPDALLFRRQAAPVRGGVHPPRRCDQQPP